MNRNAVRPLHDHRSSPLKDGDRDEGDEVRGDEMETEYEPTDPGGVTEMDARAEAIAEDFDEVPFDEVMGDARSEELGPVDASELTRPKARRRRRGKVPDKEFVPICEPCEDGRIPVSLNAPIKPSAEAIAKHNITHVPPRPWCPPCVAAKLKEDAHRRGANEGDVDDQGGLPIVSLDYNEPDAENELKVRTICGKDEATGNIIHHKVQCKGVGDEWVVKKLEIGRASCRERV